MNAVEYIELFKILHENGWRLSKVECSLSDRHSGGTPDQLGTVRVTGTVTAITLYPLQPTELEPTFIKDCFYNGTKIANLKINTLLVRSVLQSGGWGVEAEFDFVELAKPNQVDVVLLGAEQKEALEKKLAESQRSFKQLQEEYGHVSRRVNELSARNAMLQSVVDQFNDSKKKDEEALFECPHCESSNCVKEVLAIHPTPPPQFRCLDCGFKAEQRYWIGLQKFRG